MRLVHLSDLHLGYRQYQRLTPGGINQREADVALTFRRTIDQVIELRPDLVLICGDVFHTVRPSNPAILAAFQQFTRLTRALPDALVIMIAGNHDAPRTAETGCILRLFREAGLVVVDSAPERLTYPDRELSVFAVPFVAGEQHPVLEPDPTARYNVLMVHGEIAGLLPKDATPIDRASMEISRIALGAARFDYVALGHYHVYHEIEPNAWYSGSLDYTSTNTWEEIDVERREKHRKGFIERDLVTGAHTFHQLPRSRDFVDLPMIRAMGLSAAEVDAQIRAAVDGVKGGIDDKVVRLVIRDVPRHIARELDHKALRDYKRRAMHFQLDTRRPEILRHDSSGAPGRRPSLADIVRDKLRSRLLPSDVDREALVSLGLKYLDEADAVVAAQGASPLESGA